MTRLSVVVPFHNVQAYAAETLRSLRRSAAPGIEFILVDDGSTDLTADILTSQLEAVPGSRLVSCSANSGVAAARNVGIKEAKGDYITFLDGDDFVAPGYYPTLLRTIERLGCDMVRTDHVRVQGRERTVHRIGYGRRGVVGSPRQAILPVHRSTSVDAPNAWAGIYHRRLADSGLLYFPEQLRTCEDRLWNWRLHLWVDSFAIVGLLGMFYRRGVHNSLTQITDPRQFDFVAAFDLIVAEVAADRDADQLLPKAVRSYCSMICYHLDRSDSYQPDLAEELNRRCRGALAGLPAGVLEPVMVNLDERRAATLRGLLTAA